MAQRKKTIKEMQDDCARVYHFVPKPCELAEGKAQRGHYVARAWNRQGAQRQEIRPAKMPAVLATLARNGW